MKAMGIETDKEICELVCGTNPEYLELFSSSLEECSIQNIYTKKQALEYLASKIKKTFNNFNGPTIKKEPIDEALNMLAETVLAHVPVDFDENGEFNFRPKAVYVALMVRRTLQAVKDGGIVDDRDFIGNKRLELAGQLLSLLFEDLFKTWISNIKRYNLLNNYRTVDTQLRKSQRTQQYDASTAVSQTSRAITDGLFRAISSGTGMLKDSGWNVQVLLKYCLGYRTYQP
jgi:DNA-directed RNA polymerase III subunit RPC2